MLRIVAEMREAQRSVLERLIHKWLCDESDIASEIAIEDETSDGTCARNRGGFGYGKRMSSKPDDPVWCVQKWTFSDLRTGLPGRRYHLVAGLGNIPHSG